MGTFVIKPDPARDEYVYWHSGVDAPIGYGTRVQMVEILEEDWATREAWANTPQERLARADRYGSSAVGDPGNPYRFGYWDDEEFIFEQRGLLAREDLYRAAVLLDEGRDPEVWELLTPLEGEDEVRRG